MNLSQIFTLHGVDLFIESPFRFCEASFVEKHIIYQTDILR